MSFPRPGLEIVGSAEDPRITLGRPLGAGAFGIVFEGLGADGEIRFAVKFPQSGLLVSDAEMSAFLNEVKVPAEPGSGIQTPYSRNT